MLQNVCKRNHLASARIQTVTDNLIVRIVCRSNIPQSSIVFRLFHMKFQQIEAIVDREIMPCILQIQGIEAGLGFFQSYFHFAGL